MPPPAPRKATLASRIAADLRGDILRGTLAPNSKINLDRLRAQYAISISPLREAVSRLLQDGLVTFEDQRGYSVAPVSRADFIELTRLRAEIDSLALTAAIHNGSLEWESAVMAALHRLLRTSPAEQMAWIAAHSAFHMALLGGPLPRTTAICATLRLHQDRYRAHFLPIPAHQDAAQDAAEHTALAQAATRRQSARATALLRAHIEASHAHILAQMP